MIKRGGESERRKVKKGLLVMKCSENENLPYSGEDLSVNSE